MIERSMYGLLQSIAPGGAWNARLPQEATFPAIVFTAITGEPEQTQSSGYIRNVRYQVDVWAQDYTDMAQTASIVRKTLDHYKDAEVSILFAAEHEMGDPTTDLFRKVLEFDVWGN